MKQSIIALALVAAGVLFSTTASAATKNIHVNANIVGACQFKDSTDVIVSTGDIAAIDADKTIKTAVEFFCTKELNYKVSLDNGQNAIGVNKFLVSESGNKVRYEMETDHRAGVGKGFSRANAVILTTSVKKNDVKDTPVGNYKDTVVMTLEF